MSWAKFMSQCGMAESSMPLIVSAAPKKIGISKQPL
jgi:hypothetical protein